MVELQALVIATSNDSLGDLLDKTGAWAETLAVPYYFFKAKGYSVQFASMKGGRIPFDPLSINKSVSVAVRRFFNDDEAMRLVDNSVSIIYVDAQDFDAVYIAGGHGIMWDGARNKDLIRLIDSAYEAGKVVAAVGHGVAPLANARAPEGRPLVHGKQVTGMPTMNEVAMGRQDAVPFLVEDKLKAAGAIYQRAEGLDAAFAVISGNLVTGQNNASARRVAELVVDSQSMGVRLTP